MKSLALKKSHLTILVSSLLASSPLLAAEQDVFIDVDGKKMVGTLETPDNVTNPPVVLMLHGFTGSRDELGVSDTDEGVYSRSARLFAESGIASLRIDFIGSGDSDGEWQETTFSGQINDAKAAIEWLKNNDQVNSDKIGVLGWSQGGLVASHAANNADVKSVALWAPVTNPFMTYTALLGTDLVLKASQGDAEASHTATLPWGAETTLKGKFFAEVVNKSPVAAITDYTNPLLVVAGSKDDVVINTDAWMEYHNGVEKHVVLDTDHSWSAFSGPSVIDDQLMPETIAWFKNM